MRRTTIRPLLGALLGLITSGALCGCEGEGGTPAAAPPASVGSAPAPSLEQSLLRICDEGNNEACEKLSAKYLSGDGVSQSDEKAAKLNERLCKSGRTFFCPTYAFIMYEGKGTAPDAVAARKMFDETCPSDPVGCSDYGQLYVTGTGVEKNLELGLALLSMACTAGEAKACDRLRAVNPLAPRDPGGTGAPRDRPGQSRWDAQ